MTVTASHNAAGLVRVYINGALHLAFSAAKLTGLQSWIMSTRSPPMFAIEITPSAGEPILCEYDAKALWLDVLGAIDGALGSAAALDLSPTTGAHP